MIEREAIGVPGESGAKSRRRGRLNGSCLKGPEGAAQSGDPERCRSPSATRVLSLSYHAVDAGRLAYGSDDQQQRSTRLGVDHLGFLCADRRSDALLFLLRANDAPKLHKRLKERVLALRKRKNYDKAVGYLRYLTKDPACAVPLRLEAAACALKES